MHHDPNFMHPRDHDFISYRVIPTFYHPGCHYFGYRVMRIPSRAIRIPYWGRIYYCYNGIYYRPYGSYYMVCRPPFETWIEREMIHELELQAVRFHYYYEVQRHYDAIYENNRYIQEQYETIAKNNELIAQQNAILAQQNAKAAVSNDDRLYAESVYQSCQKNRLSQSYAYANANYFYQDGVFYVEEAGKYKVIIPPAGALVEYIPEDYDVITLTDGNEYYKVDDTVYTITVKEGVPYFEVLGQLYN